MTLVVTGGTGFIGSALTRRLKAAGHTVRIISRTRGHDILELSSFRNEIEGADVVFHLAALVQSRPGPFEEVNLSGLKNVLKAASEAKVRKFVYVSSFTVFGPSGDGTHNEEDLGIGIASFTTTTAPSISGYGWSKNGDRVWPPMSPSRR